MQSAKEGMQKRIMSLEGQVQELTQKNTENSVYTARLIESIHQIRLEVSFSYLL